MAIRGAHVRLVAFLFLTGVLAVVIVATLLLLGVEPRLVFLPGFTIKSWFERLGFHVPNAVGVVSTVLLWWIVILAVRFAIVKAISRKAA
jgi:hypothetical protein